MAVMYTNPRGFSLDAQGITRRYQTRPRVERDIGSFQLAGTRVLHMRIKARRDTSPKRKGPLNGRAEKSDVLESPREVSANLFLPTIPAYTAINKFSGLVYPHSRLAQGEKRWCCRIWVRRWRRG